MINQMDVESQNIMKYKYNIENENNKDVIKIVLSPDADLIIQLIILKLKYNIDNIFLCMIKKIKKKEEEEEEDKYINFTKINNDDEIITIEYISIDNLT